MMSKARSLFANRADYTIEVNDGLFVGIVDHDNGKSVTNDAAEIIQDLVNSGMNVDARIIVYRDTMGIWDRIVTKNGKCVGIESVNTKTFEEAKKKLLSKSLDNQHSKMIDCGHEGQGER